MLLILYLNNVCVICLMIIFNSVGLRVAASMKFSTWRKRSWLLMLMLLLFVMFCGVNFMCIIVCVGLMCVCMYSSSVCMDL